MLRREDAFMILRKRKDGMYIKDIAAQMGCSERTVRRILRRGGPATGRRCGGRASKLDPFKAHVDQRLAEGVWNAEVILRELRDRGYAGARTILQDYIRPKRRLQPSRATVRFETAPARQFRHDWGEIESLTLASAWLESEADRHRHGTHGEVVIERFAREEADALGALPQARFDTAYRFHRIAGWDGYVHVAGNRYSVPDAFCGAHVVCRLTLQGQLTVYGRRSPARGDEPIALTTSSATPPPAGSARLLTTADSGRSR